MRAWCAGLCVVAVAVVAASCSRRALGMFFDGVPPERKAPAVAEASSAAPARLRQVGTGEHGPYAAKLCDSCHERGATNALVVPRERLCSRCHELGTTKLYVHGPLSSGGCLVCHDPHSSRYRHLLVSESDEFCFRCHDRAEVVRIEGHGDDRAQCTDCHDAHMSDRKYLLK